MIRRGLRQGASAFRKFDQSVATPMAQKGFKSFGNVANSSAEMAWKMGGQKTASGMWKLAKSPVGISLGLGAAFGAMTYDSSKHDFTQHMATEILSTGVDDLTALGAFAINPLLGVAAVGAMVAGASPGAMIRSSMEKMQNNVARKRYGTAPITQNQRTMQASNRQLGLLGQAGRHSMLGNEASMMHN